MTKTELSPRKILEKTGYRLYVDEDVLAVAPVGDEEAVEFFKLGRYVSDNELKKEYESRGLTPANLNSTAAACKEHPYVATHWKDENGKWCFALFHRWRDERGVGVGRRDRDWGGGWWFAGVRKGLALGALAPLALDKETELAAREETGYIRGLKDAEGTKNGVQRYQMGYRDGKQDVLEQIDTWGRSRMRDYAGKELYWLVTKLRSADGSPRETTEEWKERYNDPAYESDFDRFIKRNPLP